MPEQTLPYVNESVPARAVREGSARPDEATTHVEQTRAGAPDCRRLELGSVPADAPSRELVHPSLCIRSRRSDRADRYHVDVHALRMAAHHRQYVPF